MAGRAAVEASDVAEVIVLCQPVTPQVVNLPRRIEGIKNRQRENLLAENPWVLIVESDECFLAILLLLAQPLELGKALVISLLGCVDFCIDLLDDLVQVLTRLSN